jgi:hypothetical protein
MVVSSGTGVNEWRHCSVAPLFRCVARVVRRILNLSYVGYDGTSDWLLACIVSLGANVVVVGPRLSINHPGILVLFFLGALKMRKMRHI